MPLLFSIFPTCPVWLLGEVREHLGSAMGPEFPWQMH